MKIGNLMLIGLLGLFAQNEWQEWRSNINDRIAFDDKGVPTASLWQCGLLRQRMADLDEIRTQGSPMQRQDMVELRRYLDTQWLSQRCDSALEQG
ncbi:hypothetical protein [Aeromonas molluscorum]|uniref:hypothetical protein n=1 Tax=Aeromonas molluscorum TaxID=271417 RepID=UPI003F1C219E